MQLTYRLLGADGNHYGPVTIEQLQGWISEGRVQPDMHVQRSDQTEWAAANLYQELQFPQAASAPVYAQAYAPQRTIHPNAGELLKRRKNGANWFFWIAALSGINSVIAYSGAEWGFIMGLGITQVIDTFARGLGAGGVAVGLTLDLLAAGLFVLFGVFANKGHLWAFIIGMLLYALDSSVYLLAQDWLGVGFHAFVLFCLFAGFAAARQLEE